jgi:trypsin-like peptidase
MSTSEPQRATIARPSVASLFLQMQANGQALATGTGFLVQRAGRTFLVTNRHNVRGRHNTTDELLSRTGAEPDELVVLQNVRDQLGSWLPQSPPLRDGQGHPTWHEHPALGGQIDAVALEVGNVAGIDIYPHDLWAAGQQLAFGPSIPLSIIGFPFGLTGGGAFAVWIQGSCATEPAVDWNDLPCFLVDSRTRPGQSGSPVLIYRSGGAMTMDDGSTVVTTGTQERFLGIYSGRIHEDSDLGIVWKASAVGEIVDSVIGATAPAAAPPGPHGL